MRFYLVFIYTLVVIAGYAQTHEKKDEKIVHYFSQGHLTGQIRDFSMSTINKGSLQNYHANAIGASIHYETLPFKGFTVALNGIFVYRGFSNDLLAIDSQAQNHSAYELQLFDVEHKGNFNDLDRLEELYLKYERKKHTLTYGKMEIESPMVRLHDGRMKPKVFSGFKTDIRLKSSTLTVAWFNKASPRSTTHWYTIEDAIGIYDNGYTTQGAEAAYHKTITSAGLGIVGYTMNSKSKMQLNAWNYYLDNVSNSTLLQLDVKKDTGVYGGCMYVYQRPLSTQAHSNFTFHEKTERTHLISGRLGYHFRFCDARLNATHVLSSGRFVFPREFGVDPSYTFIPRSQIEGQGNATSVGLSAIRRIKKIDVQVDWNRMLTNSSAEYNRYLLPSYDQFNLDCTYAFKHKFEGLELRFLYIYRRALDAAIPLAEQHNTVNFNQINLVANFNFSVTENRHK